MYFFSEYDGAVFGLVTSGETEDNWVIVVFHHIEDGLFDGFAKGIGIVVDFRQAAYDQGFEVSKFAGTFQSIHHALHVVDVFVDFFDEEDSVVGVGEGVGTEHATKNGEVAANNNAFDSAGWIASAKGLAMTNWPFVVKGFAGEGVN